MGGLSRKMSLAYNRKMDERKRTIGELELKKKESLRSLEAMCEDFGETLFSRVPSQENLLGDSADEYLKLQKEIIDSEGLIRLTEADTQRLRELEEEIHAKERQGSALAGDIAEACAELGRDVVGEDTFSSLLGVYRQQINVLVPKLEDAKSKLDELEERAGSGIFGWIGKNAQGAVYRTLVAKHQGTLKKLYAAAGEKLVHPANDSLILGHELEDGIRAVRDMKDSREALNREIDGLKEERRRLGNTFGADGGPMRRIQNLERHIAQIRLDLKLVYRRVGECAVDETQGERFSAVLRPEDQRVLEMVGRSRASIAEYDREIEKLKTSIAIDEEKTEIEKMARAITEQRQRIVAAEERIGDLNSQINDAEAHIEELSKLL
jgi:chromosome segregation ATPase